MNQLAHMTAQDVSDLIEADISDDWLVIVAEICKGEASCDAPANLAIKLKEAFERMDDFANGVNEDEFEFELPAYGSPAWYVANGEAMEGTL